MRISEDEYERLKNSERMKNELEKEVARLAEMISLEVKDCKVGPWCKDCVHIGRDSAAITKYTHDGIMGGECYVSNEYAGEVMYCKKHIHELCPEFERRDG